MWIRDPGSGISITDPQHCLKLYSLLLEKGRTWFHPTKKIQFRIDNTVLYQYLLYVLYMAVRFNA
jgi:hypothetical protein